MSANATNRSELVKLHDRDWLAKQKIAGQVAATVLQNFVAQLQQSSSVITLRQIEQSALSCIQSAGCQPAFLNYRGFPGAVCLSVNEVLVHGIPTDYALQDGDVVTMDVGVTYEGAIADTAFSCVYGKPKNDKIVSLLIDCQNALNAAVQSVALGRRLGVIGNTIYKKAKEGGYGVITLYGGHGLDYNTPHATPFVANQAQASEGIRIQSGLAIAIEPMFVLSPNDTNTRVLDDQWTVVTNGIGCHFEHSVTLDDTGNVHLITEHGMCVEDFV